MRAAVFIYSVFTVCRERINEGFRKNKNVSDEAEIYKVSITFLNELSNIACFLIAKFFPEMISHSYFFQNEIRIPEVLKSKKIKFIQLSCTLKKNKNRISLPYSFSFLKHWHEFFIMISILLLFDICCHDFSCLRLQRKSRR